jgi:hypothetical protein
VVVVIADVCRFIADQSDRSGCVKIPTLHRMLVVVQPAADQAGDIHHQGGNRGPVFLEDGHVRNSSGYHFGITLFKRKCSNPPPATQEVAQVFSWQKLETCFFRVELNAFGRHLTR